MDISARRTWRLLTLAVIGVFLAAPAAMAVDEPAAEPAFSQQGFADWAKQIKEPTSWLKWGADLRLREVYFDNAITLNDSTAGHEWHFQRYRTRLWATVSPAEWIDVNARLTWEFRNWCKPDTRNGEVNFDEALFDTLNITLKNPFDMPVKFVIGRHDIVGLNNWLILDGTPLDGSRTIYFDALRATIDLKAIDSTLDLIYIDNHAASDFFISPFNDQEGFLAEQNEQGAIAYFSNTSVKNTQLDAYLIYKRDVAKTTGGNTGEIYTVGGRAIGDIDENWRYRAELAGQFGHKNGATVCAFGGNAQLAYAFKDPKQNELFLSYEFLSGDDPGSDENEAFDLLWGRWPQFSELYIYTYIPETRVADVTNLHRLSLCHQFAPCDKLTLKTEYSLLWADENTKAGTAGFSQNGPFRGQLLTMWAKYKINQWVSGHLLGELFCPGNYYDDSMNDTAYFLRYELAFTW